MKITIILFRLIIVCLMSMATDANNPNEDISNEDWNDEESGIDAFLRLLARPWKKKPLEELVKNNVGRSKVRKYVAEVRLAHRRALAECRNDPVYLNEILHRRWRHGMSEAFQSRGYSSTEEAASIRTTYINLLPYLLRYSDYRNYDYDPYVEDSIFFDHLFSLRVSWKTFDIEENLLRVFNRYRELWMQRYSESLLSEVIYLWREAWLERAVSVVTEWEIYGIETDEQDVYENEFPSNIVPPYVANILVNDHNYQMRMYQHDLAKTSRLFYGLPVGTRLPSNVPKAEVSLPEAQKNLVLAATNLSSFHGDEGMKQLATVGNQFLRALQETTNDVATSIDSNEICPSDAPSCSKWENDEAGKILQCVSTEIYVTSGTSHTSRIDSPSQDGGVFSGGSARSSRSRSPQRLNLDLNRLQNRMDLFSEDGASASSELNSTSGLTTRFTINELFEGCMDFRGPQRQKRDLRLPTASSRYKKSDECKKKINQYMHSCVKMIHKRVEDPKTLISNRAEKYVLDFNNFTVSCGDYKVLRVTNAIVWLPNILESFAKTFFLFGVPVAFFAGNRDDMGMRSLELLKKNCDNKNKCSVPVDIEKASDHTSVYNLGLEVGYECAPRGCNPNLYPEYTFTVYNNEAMILQCGRDDEGLYFTSVHWEKKSGFLNTVDNVFTAGLPDDSDGKSLEFLRFHCGGRNWCNQMAILKFLTGEDSGVQATFTVNYKCLPCNVFLWNNYKN